MIFSILIRRMIIMEELLNILRDLHDDVDFMNETLLIDDGILDSFDIIQLVSSINDTFDIDIDAGDLLPENFNTVNAMWELIQEARNN